MLLFTFADDVPKRDCKDSTGICNSKNTKECGSKESPIEYWWDIQYQYADGKDGRPEPPDGFVRYVYTINGQTPGPTIHVNKGDWVKISVTNKIEKPDKSKESTAIHWHGISMRGVERQTIWNPKENPGSPFMDGVPGINQCPIKPGETFVYLFQCVDSGTFWYHSHQGVQLADGLVGALIVKDCNDSERFGYHEEDDWDANIVNVQDWYHEPAADILKKYMKIDDTKNFTITTSNKAVPKEKLPSSGLVGGTMFNNCSQPSCKSPECQCVPRKYKVYKFDEGKTYRLRLISMAAISMAYFSIDNHEFEIIEVDGMLVKRTDKQTVPWNQIPINTGQRYSILIKATQPSNNYWMRFKFPTCSYRANSGAPTYAEAKAIVRYGKAPEVDPDTVADIGCGGDDCDCTDLDPFALMPLCDEKSKHDLCNSPPPEGKYNFTMDIIMDAFGNKSPYYHEGEWEQNFYGYIADKAHGIAPYDEHSYSHSSNNTFLKVLYLSDPNNHFDGWNSSMNAYNLKDGNSVVDILFKNIDEMEHPIHLHGHFFYVLGWGTEENPTSKIKLNTKNPIQRDTATVPSQGWLKIRFTVDNPGVWPMHCHIDWHIAIGMLAQFVELPRDAINIFNQKVPYEWCKACTADAAKYCSAKK